MAILRWPLDFIFDFASAPLLAGDKATTGDNIAHTTLVSGSRIHPVWEMPADSIGEIEGVEILLQPDAITDIYNPLEYVRVEINEVEIENITFNELTAQMQSGGAPPGGDPFRDGCVCTNIGKGLLVGGDPTTSTIKIGPKDKVRVVVKNTRAAYGGVTINELLVVRLWVATATQFDLEQKWTDGRIPIGTASAPKTILAEIEKWTEGNGGAEVKTPHFQRYITYAKNITPTTQNDPYTFARRAGTTEDIWSDLDWRVDTTKVVQLTHVGVAEDESNGIHVAPNVSWIKLPHYPVELPLVYPVAPYPSLGQFPMPLNRNMDPTFGAPGKLPQPINIYNENCSLTVRDRGDPVVAWAPGDVGVKIAVWGYIYYV